VKIGNTHRVLKRKDSDDAPAPAGARCSIGFRGAYQKRSVRILPFRKDAGDRVSVLNMGGIIESMLVQTMIITDASACALSVVEGDHLRVFSHASADAVDLKKTILKIGKGIVGRVAVKRMPLLVADVDEEPRYVEYIHGIKSKRVVPIVGKDNTLKNENGNAVMIVAIREMTNVRF